MYRPPDMPPCVCLWCADKGTVFFRAVTPLIDIHTHHPVADAVCIRNVRLTETVVAVPPEGLFSAGIHPWDTAEAKPEWLEWFCTPPQRLAAVGEIGLDLRSAYAPTPVQTAWFERQIKWANQMEKPLIIHQVRATEATQRILHSGARTPVILHGYTGNSSLTAQWLQQVPDVHFSFGFRSLQTPKAVESLKWLATHHPERLFLETDDDPYHPIAEIYTFAAKTLDRDRNGLTEQIYRNFTTLFPTL